MAGIQLNLTHRGVVGVEAACRHKVKRSFYSAGEPLVAFPYRTRCNEFLIPVVNLTEVCIAAPCEGSKKVQCRCRGVVRLK